MKYFHVPYIYSVIYEMVCLFPHFSAAYRVFFMHDSYKILNENACWSCSGNIEAAVGAGPYYLLNVSESLACERKL